MASKPETQTPTQRERDLLRECSATCVVAFRVLIQAQSPLTSREIADAGACPQRTIQEALGDLCERDLARRVPRLSDPHCPRYVAIRHGIATSHNPDDS